MKFDRTAPCGSVEAACRMENGKAVLEWAFHLVQDSGEAVQKVPIPYCTEEERNLLGKEKGYIGLTLTDRQNNTVLECVQMLWEEEPLQSILLQPDFWNGIRHPYLYGMEAILTDEAGNLQDRIQGQLALRCLAAACRNGHPEIRLNNEPFVPKPVRYALPETGTEAAIQRHALEDFQWMMRLGANCVCVEEPHKLLLQLCDRHGLLVFIKDEKRPGYVWAHGNKAGFPVLPSLSNEEIPLFRGKNNSLFRLGSSRPAALFYRYQAKWSGVPFVHIVPESIQCLENGNFAVLCYSNCDRVALYSDGILFEFKDGETEFWFREVPARTPSIMLAAEGEGCCETLSLHKSFTK